MLKVLILSNLVPDPPTKDDEDTIDQVIAVKSSLDELGYDVHHHEIDFDFKTALKRVRDLKPDIIFNLVETLEESGKFAFIGASIADHLKIPYTGNTALPLMTTTDKTAAKKILGVYGVPTPEIFSGTIKEKKRFIVKAIAEDASIGLDEDSVVETDDPSVITGLINERADRFGKLFFAEEFIDGREFNIAVLEMDGKPVVMSPAEIMFTYPEGKLKIVDYKAKWIEEAFEYNNTERGFDFPEHDNTLLSKLRELSLKCWDIFGLSGYARVDFRVDQNSNPYVLEINGNPCITKVGGFAAACNRYGITYTEMINQLVKSGLNKKF